MDKKKFNKIKKKYGPVASWAIWKEVGETPKSNMEDLNILDPQQNPNLLSELKPNVVFVGLNTSKDISGLEPFSNFHPTNPFANDYKTRYALKNTQLWGGYMTDIIKDHPELKGQAVVKHLRKYPEVVDENIETFRKELKDLGTKNPTIIAFGNAAHSILTRHLKDEFKILKVYHYSYFRINKKRYREHVKSVVSEGS